MYGKPEANLTHLDVLTNKVHAALAHSYFFNLLFLVIGIVLDFLFPLKLFSHPSITYIGVVFLVLATALIFWSQHTTRNLHENDTLTKEAFCRGPYCYTRTPTHWGLFVLILGFGVVLNAFFVVLTTVLSFVFSKFIFLKKYDRALEEKYGAPYLEYKEEVRL